MSIILKGIDLPKQNQICEIEINPDGHCVVMKIEEGECYSLEFNSETNAIQIPTPHGRLVDWDLFNSKLDIQYAEGRGKALAPTILEEEK